MENSAWTILFLILYITYIHSITFIQYIDPSSFAEVLLDHLIAGRLSGKNLRGAEPRIELGPAWQQGRRTTTELRRTLQRATPHPNCATPHPD